MTSRKKQSEHSEREGREVTRALPTRTPAKMVTRRSTRSSTRFESELAVEMKKKKALVQSSQEEGEKEEAMETDVLSDDISLSLSGGKKRSHEDGEEEAERDDDADFEEEISGGGRRRCKRNRQSPASYAPSRPPKPRSRSKRVSAPNPADDSSDEEEDGVEEDEMNYLTRSSAASTAKRCCSVDGEGMVDLCVKVLAQACGLDPSSAHLFGETRANRSNEGDDDEEEDEDEIYAEFGKSLAETFSSEGKLSGGCNVATMVFGKTARSRSLENNLVHFWNQLVMLLHGKEILYGPGSAEGGRAMDALDGATQVDFLSCMSHVCVELSKSEIRSFRYAACLCGYALLGSLVRVHQSLDETNAVLTKQLRAVGHSAAKKNQRRDLNKRLQECHERSNTIDTHMKNLFQELVIVRFRDVAPQIRALTIRWVGIWVVQHPKKFLSDGYLKYVAWSLNDKDAQVRLAAVQALKQVYQRHAAAARGGDADADEDDTGPNNNSSFSNLSALDLLTQRFSGRFVELVKDVNEQVCVNALDLVLSLAEAQLIDVSDDEVAGSLSSDLPLLLLDKSPKVRKGAGRVVALVIDARLAAAAKSPGAAKRKQKRRKDAAAAAAEEVSTCVEACKLVDTLVCHEIPESVLSKSPREEDVYLKAISAVVPHLPSNHDWEVWAKDCRSKDLEDDDDLIAIVRVAVAAIKHFTDPKAVKDFLLAGKQRGKKVMASAVADFCEKTVQQFTMAFMPVLSKLFSQTKSKKGSVGRSLVCLLCELACVMQQELYVATGHMDEFTAMTDVLWDLWKRKPPKTTASETHRFVHFEYIANCLGLLETTGPGGTREVAQARMKDAMDAVQAQMNKGLDKVPAEEAKLAVAKIKALRAKFMANEDLKEKVKGVLQGYLKSQAQDDDDEEEDSIESDEESGQEESGSEGSEAAEDEESESEEEMAPSPPRRSRRRL